MKSEALKPIKKERVEVQSLKILVEIARVKNS